MATDLPTRKAFKEVTIEDSVRLDCLLPVKAKGTNGTKRTVALINRITGVPTWLSKQAQTDPTVVNAVVKKQHEIWERGRIWLTQGSWGNHQTRISITTPDGIFSLEFWPGNYPDKKISEESTDGYAVASLYYSAKPGNKEHKICQIRMEPASDDDDDDDDDQQTEETEPWNTKLFSELFHGDKDVHSQVSLKIKTCPNDEQGKTLFFNMNKAINAHGE